MLYPSIQDLTNKDVNRYMLVIAAAKSARYVTYKQNKDLEYYELRKEFEKPPFDENHREKAVSAAVEKLHNGEFKVIVE